MMPFQLKISFNAPIVEKCASLIESALTVVTIKVEKSLKLKKNKKTGDFPTDEISF